jgi:hypothetical protein
MTWDTLIQWVPGFLFYSQQAASFEDKAFLSMNITRRKPAVR